MTPQGPEADLPVSVWGPSAEAWVGSGLPREQTGALPAAVMGDASQQMSSWSSPITLL